MLSHALVELDVQRGSRSSGPVELEVSGWRLRVSVEVLFWRMSGNIRRNGLYACVGVRFVLGMRCCVLQYRYAGKS